MLLRRSNGEPVELNPRGQAGQDRFAFAVTGRPETGAFLDIGSGDPIIYNNSCMLEEYGWRGLLVDRCDCKDVGLFRRTPFLQADAMSIDWVTTLIANELGPRIDYLSFDLDNDGESALTRLPWQSVRFSCMTVEHDGYRFGDGPRAAMRQLLLGHGYRLLCPDVVLDGFGAFEDWWVDPSSVATSVADSFATTGPTNWQEIITKGEQWPKRSVA
jgi:hypothetical protein